MMAAGLRELSARVEGAVEFDAPLAGHTTYRIGGPAAALVHPASSDDVAAVLSYAAETDTRWLALGLGSNVLVADRGFDGIALKVGKGLADIEPGVEGDATLWRAGAGAPTPLVARRSADAGLSGVHRLIGVPGTVGGGVFMNAGAHGQDFSLVVESIELATASGGVTRLRGEEIPWAYRTSRLGPVVVLGAWLRLDPAPIEDLKSDVRKHFEWRKAGTPFNEPCCGSVFRNPPVKGGGERRTAGQLIEAAGMKGHRVGGAVVSPKHANYIVNTGSATASDVLAVIDAVRERVLRAFGVELELEVKLIE
jgi:UDP-N-acetylmuramate dehydrogenase